jgi:glycosyltransferase involved in cell wall biosynthesis
LTKWYHAPPVAARSGVADYAHRLLPALGNAGVNLYHLGNNPLHNEIYTTALAQPGIAVLHDAVLHHFLLGRLARDEYITEFVYNYGEWKRPLAEELWDARSSSGINPRYFQFPMIRRIVERSTAVIVHNPGAAEIVKAHGGVDVYVIPHFYEPAPVDIAAAAYFRERARIPQTAKLFGIFGYLRETKRIASCLTAFRRLRAVEPDAHLLIAGEPVSADLARVLQSECVTDGIHRTGHLTDDQLNTAAAAIDCCVNLRYPAAGETSGIAIRMMGIGKPVIMSRGLETSGLPEYTWLGVTPGPGETEELLLQMSLVARLPGLARDIGEQARIYITQHHSIETVAAKYRELLIAYNKI